MLDIQFHEPALYDLGRFILPADPDSRRAGHDHIQDKLPDLVDLVFP